MKYSYKGSEMQSSVVILTDGRAMEIRRGEKTIFAEGERRFWASWSEWMGTLPDGAEVVESASAPTAAKPAVTNPVLLRFMGRAGAAAGRSLGPASMGYAGTRAEVVCEERQRLVDFLMGGYMGRKTVEQRAHALAAFDARMAPHHHAGTADLPVFYTISPTSYITQTADGELQEVRWNKAYNAIGYFHNKGSFAWEHRVLGVGFVPLTDPEMPLWRLVRGAAPKKI